MGDQPVREDMNFDSPEDAAEMNMIRELLRMITMAPSAIRLGYELHGRFVLSKR